MRIKFVRSVVAPVPNDRAKSGEVHDLEESIASNLIGEGAAEPTDEPLTFPPDEDKKPAKKKDTP